jgi:hypothetical protein
MKIKNYDRFDAVNEPLVRRSVFRYVKNKNKALPCAIKRIKEE